MARGPTAAGLGSRRSCYRYTSYHTQTLPLAIRFILPPAPPGSTKGTHRGRSGAARGGGRTRHAFVGALAVRLRDDSTPYTSPWRSAYARDGTHTAAAPRVRPGRGTSPA